MQGQGVGYSVAVMAARVAYLAYTQPSFNRAALLLLQQQLPAALPAGGARVAPLAARAALSARAYFGSGGGLRDPLRPLKN